MRSIDHTLAGDYNVKHFFRLDGPWGCALVAGMKKRFLFLLLAALLAPLLLILSESFLTGFHARVAIPADDPLTQALSRTLDYLDGIDPSTRYIVAGRELTAAELADVTSEFAAMAASGLHEDELLAAARERFDFVDPDQADVLVTGYYEDEIAGSVRPQGNFSAPVYGRPVDLVRGVLSDSQSLPSISFGRIRDGALVPYLRRDEIVNRALPAPVLCYVDPVDLFFMQIEGGGRVVFPDGASLRLSYDSDNGMGFLSIASVLAGRCDLSRDGIAAFLKRSRADADRYMNVNPRYVFFRESADGPRGSIGSVLVPGRSVATDQSVIPAGMIGFITAVNPGRGGGGSIERFVTVHDTGNAIRGNHVDVFFGSGPDARSVAERTRVYGRILLLVPKR